MLYITLFNYTIESAHYVTDGNGVAKPVIPLFNQDIDKYGIQPSGGIVVDNTIFQYWEIFERSNDTHYAYCEGVYNKTNATFEVIYTNTTVKVVPRASILSLDGAYVYFYMVRDTDIILARSAANLQSLRQHYTQYEFWNGTKNGNASFVQMPVEKVQPIISGFSSPELDVIYNTFMRRFLMLETSSKVVFFRTAEQPWGKWSVASQVYTVPANVTEVSSIYFHPELSFSNQTKVLFSYCSLPKEQVPTIVHLQLSER